MKNSWKRGFEVNRVSAVAARVRVCVRGRVDTWREKCVEDNKRKGLVRNMRKLF